MCAATMGAGCRSIIQCLKHVDVELPRDNRGERRRRAPVSQVRQVNITESRVLAYATECRATTKCRADGKRGSGYDGQRVRRGKRRKG